MKEYYDKFIKKEDEGKCLHCKKPTKFTSFGQGYRMFCSYKCSANHSNTKKKKENSYLKSLGVKNPSQSKDCKEKIKRTCLERYGFGSPLQSNEIQEKREKTCLEKYGVKNYASSKEYRKYKEQNGEWLSLKESSRWKIYFLEVWKETNKWKKILFENWNGLDYYTGEKLISNEEFNKLNPHKHPSNNFLQPTIDHKKCIKYGLENDIDPKIIGHISNLCICSRSFNSRKNVKMVEHVGIEPTS